MASKSKKWSLNLKICGTGLLEHITASKHRIKLSNQGVRQIHCELYRPGPRTRAIGKAQLDRLLNLDVVEPAQKECAAPIDSVPKKDGTLQFSVDYLGRNAFTARYSYPILLMHKSIQSIGDARVFST